MRLSHPRPDETTAPEPPAVQQAEEARRRLRTELRGLAANLISVSRGAGKPWALCSEVDAVARDLETYRRVIGGYPSPEELSTMVRLGDAPRKPTPRSTDEMDWALSLSAAVRGGLRIAAARLLDLPTEEVAGETELYHGINGMEALRIARNAGRLPR